MNDYVLAAILLFQLALGVGIGHKLTRFCDRRLVERMKREGYLKITYDDDGGGPCG